MTIQPHYDFFLVLNNDDINSTVFKPEYLI